MKLQTAISWKCKEAQKVRYDYGNETPKAKLRYLDVEMQKGKFGWSVKTLRLKYNKQGTAEVSKG